MTRLQLLLPVLLILSLSLQAEERIRRVPLDAASGGGQPGGSGSLTVTADPRQPYRVLVELTDPGITSPIYALKGRVRYEGVHGDGFLQMDSHFAGKGTYFSKGLATVGPLRRISGSSDWRLFVLPFFADAGDQAGDGSLTPSKLSFGIYLPESGSVTIRDVALYQYAPGEDPLRADGQ